LRDLVLLHAPDSLDHLQEKRWPEHNSWCS
jgi:hypothetical protein